MDDLFMNLNFVAIVIAGAIYWLVGMLWFPVLFGRTWAKELAKIGLVIRTPSPNEMGIKSVITYAVNTFTALGIAIIFQLIGVSSVGSAVAIGIALSLFFSVAIIAVSCIWESRSLLLFAIDSGYHTCGIVACSILLSLWK